MIVKGKVIYMYFFLDCDFVNLDKSNMINVQVYDVCSEIFIEVEW